MKTMYLAGELPFEHHQESVRQATQDLIASKSEEIVSRLSFRLTRNPAMVELLGSGNNQSRLEQTMTDWLAITFDHNAISADPEAFVHYQAHVGRFQSYANVNLAMVSYVKLMLKRIIEDEIEESHSNSEALMLSRYANEMIDYAVDLFHEACRHAALETIHHHHGSIIFPRAANSRLN